MPDDREHRRRYGDKEVGLILKRAAELQRQAPASAAEGGGLSIAELEEIAAEVGIDTAYIGRAAEELDDPAIHGEGVSLLTGAPLVVELERSIAGELPESAFDRLVPLIQKAAKGRGQPSLIGRTFTWQSERVGDWQTLQVSVTARDGRTRIWVEERYDTVAGSLFGGMVGGVGGGIGLGVGLGVGIGALGSVLFSVAFPAVLLGGSYFVARTIYTALVNKRKRVLHDLMDRLTAEVTDLTSENSLEERPGRRGLPRP
jgi:hypothetical protein